MLTSHFEYHFHTGLQSWDRFSDWLSTLGSVRATLAPKPCLVALQWRRSSLHRELPTRHRTVAHWRKGQRCFPPRGSSRRCWRWCTLPLTLGLLCSSSRDRGTLRLSAECLPRWRAEARWRWWARQLPGINNWNECSWASHCRYQRQLVFVGRKSSSSSFPSHTTASSQMIQVFLGFCISKGLLEQYSRSWVGWRTLSQQSLELHPSLRLLAASPVLSLG